MRLSVSIFLFFTVTSALAETSVWKISNGVQYLFIAGTIHVLARSDYPLPGAFNDSYRQSQKVYFETDIEGVNNIEFQKKMLTALSYKDGKTLKTALKTDTYNRLASYCQSVGLPIEALHNLKPGVVSISLTLTELQRLGLAGSGVDNYFYQLAIKDKKLIGQFETVDQQLGFIINMGVGQENELIESTLDEIKDLPKLMKQLKGAWREGNSKRLDEIAVKNIRLEFPQLYKNLFLDRNNAWLPKIETMLNTNEIEMVLVGAGHLVGRDGIIDQLIRKGYKVQQL